ncbi:MAG: heparan-alpha-glucosaminide N-acetyltransferase domain-containing protein [Ornithinimicrobium sp.]
MSQRGRIIGIDVARALALLGMVVAHMIDQAPGEGLAVDPWFQVVAGRSSALFAVLAGVSIVLASRQSPFGAASGATITLAPGARRSIGIRAALLIAIGLVLGIPDVGVAVILLYYGALFLCAIPVLRWNARSLVILAICWGMAAPVVSMLLRPFLPAPDLMVPEPASLLDPIALLLELSVTGYYPVLTWATYLFAGMALGRLNLRSDPVARRMVLLGLGLAVAALGLSGIVSRNAGVREVLITTYDITGGVNSWPELSPEITRGFFGTTPTDSWWWLGIWAPHSGSIIDLAHTTGCAAALLGGVLMITGRLSREGRRLVHIVFGAGTMTLTLYAVHIVLLGAPPALGWTQTISFHVVVLGSLGALFVAANARGPLELAVSRIGSLPTTSRQDQRQYR